MKLSLNGGCKKWGYKCENWGTLQENVVIFTQH
jgi:hypothetical protein